MKKTTDTLSQLAYIDLENIAVSKTNSMFRDAADFHPDALAELTTSIRDKGVIQPILLRPADQDGTYFLVAGERRFRASELVRATFPERNTIPAFIREMTDAEALELQIVENLQRENINPIREARGFAYLVKDKKLSTSSIAARLGKSIDYVQERLRLTELIDPIQDLIKSGELPIKAGLKMARIPKELQQDCLDNVTTRINLGDKKGRVVFEGLDRLQSWMDSELWTDLTRADFNKEDPKLNPAMGPCSTCQHRSKNTGGLFDDITLEDKCLLASCFRTKQVNTYKALKETMQKKYPGKTIVFRERDHGIDARDLFKKQLGEPIKSTLGGQEVKEAELLKNKDAEVAILVGIPRWNSESLAKKVMFTKPKETSRATAVPKGKDGKPLTAEQVAKANQAEKERQERAAYQDTRESLLIAGHILSHAKPPADRHIFLKEALVGWFADAYGDTGIILSAFKTLGIDWYQDDAKGKRQLVKAATANLESMADWDDNLGFDDLRDTIAPLKAEQVEKLFSILYYICEPQRATKLLKMNTKEIKAKAAKEAQAWWSRKQAAAAANKQSDKAVGKLVDKLLKPAKKKGGAKK